MVSVACYRMRRGQEIAAKIRRAASHLDATSSDAATVTADLLGQCAGPGNIWHAEDLHNDAGELYEGLGVGYACGQRLCPSCMESRRRKSRARARAGLQRAKFNRAPGELQSFVTLTAPTLPASEVSLIQSLSIFQDAWRRLTKHNYWRSKVRAGVKGVEFTLGRGHEREGREWMPEVDGYHVHIHTIVFAPWLEWRTLRAVWTNCLRAAWRQAGIENGINTKDGFAIVDVRKVTGRKVKGQRALISEDGAVCEVAKYITKCESWLKVPDVQIGGVAAVEKWPRMFELLGDCREQRQESGPASRAGSDQDEEAQEARREAEETLVAIDAAWYDMARAGAGRQELDALAAATARAYLDTQNLSAANLRRSELPKARRARGQPIRQRGRELLARGDRQTWLEELSNYAERVREFRRGMLSTRYPYATFRTLDGGKWFGLDASPATSFEPAALYSQRAELHDQLAEQEAETAEAAAVEAYQWERAVAVKDRSDFRALLHDQEQRQWYEWVNERGLPNWQREARMRQWEIFNQS